MYVRTYSKKIVRQCLCIYFCTLLPTDAYIFVFWPRKPSLAAYKAGTLAVVLVCCVCAGHLLPATSEGA